MLNVELGKGFALTCVCVFMENFDLVIGSFRSRDDVLKMWLVSGPKLGVEGV